MIEGEKTLTGINGRTIDLTVMVDDGEYTDFSMENWHAMRNMERVIPNIKRFEEPL